MSWTDEDIDKLFAENAHPHAEFKEEYWHELEAMLPEKRRNGFAWYKLAAGFGAAALLFVSLFYFNSSTSAIEPAVRTAKNEQGNTNQKVSESVSNKNFHNTPKANTYTEIPSVSGTNFSEKARDNQRLQSQSRVESPANFSLSEDPEAEILLDESMDKSISSQVETSQESNSSNPAIRDEFRIDILKQGPVVFENSVSPLSAVNEFRQAPKMRFYVDLTAGFGQSMIQNGKELTKNVGLAAGVQFPLRKLRFNAGLGFASINYNNLEINEQSTRYGFYKTTYLNKFRYKELYLAQLPLQLEFPTKVGTFEFLLTPGYLIQTKMKYSYYENEMEVDRNLIYGETKGIEKFSVQSGFGYKMELMRGWEIGCRVQTELIQNVEYKEITNIKFPIQGQLLLRKNLNF